MLTGPTQPLPVDALGMRRLAKVVVALFIPFDVRLVQDAGPIP
jgi:hypothetical protein